MWLEIPFGSNNPPTWTFALTAKGWNINGLAVQTVQLGLVVESIDLARPTVHEKEDHTARLGSMVQKGTVQIGRKVW